MEVIIKIIIKSNIKIICYILGFKLTPRSQYWRLNNQSSRFIKCPIPENCIGDSNNPKISSYNYYLSSEICGKYK